MLDNSWNVSLVRDYCGFIVISSQTYIVLFISLA